MTVFLTTFFGWLLTFAALYFGELLTFAALSFFVALGLALMRREARAARLARGARLEVVNGRFVVFFADGRQLIDLDSGWRFIDTKTGYEMVSGYTYQDGWDLHADVASTLVRAENGRRLMGKNRAMANSLLRSTGYRDKL